MKLTVLGKYGPFPAPGGACSGYLLESNEAKLLIDCGSGVLSRLLSVTSLESLDGILLSHLHSDHMSDMLILRYAIQQYQARGVHVPYPLFVAMPEEPEAEYKQLAMSGVYDITIITDKMKLKIKDLTITFTRVIHPVPTYAMRIQDHEKTFVYTGDTGYIPELTDLCRDADLLLADTNFLSVDKTKEVAPHLTAEEAGRLARDASVKALLCTHIWGGGYSDKQICDEAQKHFPDAEVVQELKLYQI